MANKFWNDNPTEPPNYKHDYHWGWWITIAIILGLIIGLIIEHLGVG